MNRVPPFDTRTPLVEKTDGRSSGVARSHIKFFQVMVDAVNASPQVVNGVPANSAAKGTKGQVVYSGLDKYEHNGTQWIKFSGVTF